MMCTYLPSEQTIDVKHPKLQTCSAQPQALRRLVMDMSLHLQLEERSIAAVRD